MFERVRVSVFFHALQKVALLEMNKMDFDTVAGRCNTVVLLQTPKEEWPLFAHWLFCQDDGYPTNVCCLEVVDMKQARKSLEWKAQAQIVIL